MPHSSAYSHLVDATTDSDCVSQLTLTIHHRHVGMVRSFACVSYIFSTLACWSSFLELVEVKGHVHINKLWLWVLTIVIASIKTFIFVVCMLQWRLGVWFLLKITVLLNFHCNIHVTFNLYWLKARCPKVMVWMPCLAFAVHWKAVWMSPVVQFSDYRQL